MNAVGRVNCPQGPLFESGPVVSPRDVSPRSNRIDPRFVFSHTIVFIKTENFLSNHR